MVNPLAGEKLIPIEVDVIPGLMVSADKEMVNLIIRNMLSNAVKFTSSGNRVTIRAFETNGNVLVQVSNEGDPIPDAVRETLFTFHSRS